MATAVGDKALASRLNQGPGLASRLWALSKKKPLGAFGALIMIVLVFSAATAPIIAPYDPLMQLEGQAFLGPTWAHPFGTDYIGRDMLSRILYGAQISLMVGAISVSIGTGVGASFGLVSGYWGGKFDLITQRFVDAMQAFPGLVLNLAIVAMLGKSLVNVMIAVGIGGISGPTRLVRSAVLSVRETQYVDAAKAIGARDSRIIIYHILPNVAAPILIIVTAGLGGAILAESSLSFLGFGAQPPQPAWGLMLSGAGRAYMMSSPWLAIFPGMAISLAVLGFNLLGDALRDIWDPRLRGSR